MVGPRSLLALSAVWLAACSTTPAAPAPNADSAVAATGGTGSSPQGTEPQRTQPTAGRAGSDAAAIGGSAAVGGSNAPSLTSGAGASGGGGGTAASSASPAGMNAAGASAPGSNAAGSNSTGANAAGSNAAGSNSAGSNATGSSTAGANAAGANAAGSNATDSGGSGATAPVGCAKPDLILCDDFESNTAAGAEPPSPRWSVVLNGMGSVTIDDSVAAHSGTKSVHVSSRGGYQTFFALRGAPVFPAAGALYLRLFVRLGAPMSSGHNTYYKAGAAGMPSSEHETRIGVMNSMLMINQPAGDRGFLSNQNYYTDGNKPGVVFTPLSWTCVEALFDPAHTTFDIWVDGKEVPDLHRTDWQQDPLGAFHFGYEKYAGPDADIWYDDIAVSAQRIGCE